MSDQPPQPPPDRDPEDAASPPTGGPPPPSGGTEPPPPPRPPSGTPGGSGAPSTTGLDTNVASMLAYLLMWVSGLVLFLIEKEDREVRFHAAQSVIVWGALTALWIVVGIVSFVPFLGVLLVILALLLFGLGGLLLWIFMLVQAYQGRHVKLPIAGDLAEQWAATDI